MFCTGVVYFALVGGNYTNGVKAGLWYWNLNETSTNSWTTIGARLLIMVFDVCEYLFNFSALVGGEWNNTVEAGLWYWYFDWAFSQSSANVGARLLIMVFDV